MDDLTGNNLGPYRILDRIGAGGMATVYRAYHAAMDRYVAIKVLPRHLARDPNFHARFLREARTIARLEHRYILTVHDVGEADGVPFLVMRYTDSGDLSGLIADRSLTLARTVKLIGQVAEALAYAHRQGVIHRDVKPANVLISSDGDALLTDFGIAKIYAETLQLTSENQLVGTPAYMAPEQIQAQPVDARTDVYALGVVLYQAITGDPPFAAETPLALALMHLHNPLRPPRQINPAIPETLERVVLRAMAKDPGDRFQSADEFAQALRAELSELDRPGVGQAQAPSTPLAAPAQPPSTPVVLPAQPIQAQPAPAAIDHPAPAAPTRRQTPRPILLAGAGAAVLLVVILAVLLLRSRAPVSPTPAAAGVAAPAAGTPGSADLRYPADATKINGLAVSPNAIWAATDGGLVRWGADGNGRLFTEDDGLPLDEPGAIAAAADGTVWVGGGGVAHIRPTDSGISVVSSYTKDDGLGSGVIRTLLLDSDGSLWAGGPQGDSRFALSHLTGDSWHTDELPTDDPAFTKDELQIQSLLRSQDGSLWLGLRRGVLLRWDGKRWDRFDPAEGAASAADSDTRIRRLVQSSDGTLWAAASQLGLLRFDAAQGRWQRVAITRDTPIRTIAQLADGSLWAAGDSMIARSSDGGQSWADVPTPSTIGNDIGALVQDSAGRIWAGAYDGGISVFDGTQWRLLQR